MEKTQKKYFIGKITKADIRKAYFKRKIPGLLAKVQETKDLKEEDLDKLKKYLKKLREKEGTLLETIEDVMPDYDDEVLKKASEEKLSEREQKIYEEEKKKRKQAVMVANKLLKWVAKKYISDRLRNPKKEELIDVVFELLGLTAYIDEEKLFAKQDYKKKIIEYEMAGKQRKTAEEYAMVSKEYRNYKRLVDLSRRIEEFSQTARKRWSEGF